MSLKFSMRFLFCFCPKRDRTETDISTTNISYKNSVSTTTPPPVTAVPIPASSNIPPIPVESDYEKILDLSADEGIDVINDHQTSTTSIENSACAELTSIPSQQKLFDDDTHLYATIDKTKKTKNRINNDVSADLQQSSTESSSSATHTSNLPQAEHLPAQVYTNTFVNTAINENKQTSSPHPQYDEVITRESLEHRTKRLQIEDEQNPYSSINSEQGTTTDNNLYAEITNENTSDTVQSNSQSSHYCRLINDDNDTSEHDGTVIETNNTKQQSTTN